MKFLSAIFGALYMLGVVASYNEGERNNVCRQRPYPDGLGQLAYGTMALIWPASVLVVGLVETMGGDTISACDTKFKPHPTNNATSN